MTAKQFLTQRRRLFETRENAAAKMGVTVGCIGHWETGRRPIPLWATKFLKCVTDKHYLIRESIKTKIGRPDNG